MNYWEENSRKIGVRLYDFRFYARGVGMKIFYGNILFSVIQGTASPGFCSSSQEVLGNDG